MAAEPRLICDAEEVIDAGNGFRFEVEREGKPSPAFLIRFRGKVYGYLNRCAHISIELDWNQGEFFDYSKLYLICSTHGATYVPDSGHCIAGPCKGLGLQKLTVEERDGKIYVLEE